MKENIRGWRTNDIRLFSDILHQHNLYCVDGYYKDNVEYNFIRDNETKYILFIVPELDMKNFYIYYEKYKMNLRITKINKIRNEESYR